MTTRLLISSALLFLTACGAGALPSRAPSTTQALTGTAEWLEFEAPVARTDMFRDVARTSQNQAGLRATGQMVFPRMVNGEFVAAPGIDPRMDLLMSADAGGTIQL